MARRSILAGRFALISLFWASAQLTQLVAQAPAVPVEQLRSGFQHPPATAATRCYWWWLVGNTTPETITRDLEGMKAKGIHGAILVDADGSGQQGNVAVPQGPQIGSPAWNALLVHALAEAKRLDLEISLNVTSRGNVGIIGGPTVTPADAIKHLVWTRVEVTGGAERTLHLHRPLAVNGFYQQIAVLAYPLRHGMALPGKPGSNRAGIPDLLFKSATVETGFSTPHEEKTLRTRSSVAGEQDADLADVVDLTAKCNAQGELNWKFPQGKWEVLVMGYTNTPKQLAEEPRKFPGLALDVLSAESFDHYWQQAVMPLLKEAKPYIGSSLRYLVVDSWEAGGTNWSQNFRAEFQKRRGYDPLPYLPIVSGRILSNREVSDNFLFDLRRTVADLITENCYDRFAAHAAEVGLGVHPESGGPHGAPIDALETFRSASFAQSEYWADSGWHRVADEERFFVKEASSAAHIYGKNIVAAEGPTSMHRSAWSEALGSNVQPTIDRAYTEGLDRLFWHEFTSSPEKYGKPGQEYFAGTHLNPNVTWWPEAGALVLSANRAQFLLQQGNPVNDLLYFYGNQVPNFVRVKNDDPAHVLPGYDYDVTGEDALLKRMQADGAGLKTPEGIRYRALALPANGHVSLAALRWVEQYVAGGGTLIGVRPTAPLGIVSAATEAEYKQLSDRLWKGCAAGTKHNYGKGLVVCTTDAHNALQALGVSADFSYTSKTEDPHPVQTPLLDYVHRTIGDAEVYFVRNTQAHALEATLSFRVEGRTPELWSAEDGVAVPVRVYRATADHRTDVPLSFPAYGSVFVVFAQPAQAHFVQLERNGQTVFPAIHAGSELFYAEKGMVAAASGDYSAIDAEGQTLHAATVQLPPLPQPSGWSLSFPAGWGAPRSIPVKSFQSWTASTLPGVRYFSGNATYRTTVKVSEAALGQPLWLRLGEVREIAAVRINGVDAGTVWRAPYVVRMDGLVKAGENQVEIDVANLWPNRLIGDLQPGVTQRYTQTNSRAYRADSPLLPSGILQPVQFQPGVVLEWKR